MIYKEERKNYIDGRRKELEERMEWEKERKSRNLKYEIIFNLIIAGLGVGLAFGVQNSKTVLLNKNKEHIFNRIEEERIFSISDLESYRMGYDINHPEVQFYDFNRDGTNDARIIIEGYDPKNLLKVGVVELYNNKREMVKEYFGGKDGKLETSVENSEKDLGCQEIAIEKNPFLNSSNYRPNFFDKFPMGSR